MLPIQHQRIKELLHHVGKLSPAELAPVLASFYTGLSFAVARQQLQQLADTFSIISVTVAGFVMDTDWQHRESADAQHQREETRKATGPQGEAMLSASQVATKLNVTKAKVYAMIHAGILPATDINKGKGKPLLRIRASDVP
ncbi:helix-turn-helix domain-containing protein [Hymenobacter convexus]|uniref:helix-turn-helix domain-containing protein n=1 Tax=Hymenobacter sp. CA1UV-4 TaxID=3063782 RepID=UPI0027126857|nr:helix-turn-helix domain-containing protein [Hymenobacter sp. CA1UV-4]MDO7853428.1 helix-turn-helix domain-containing protein [Hymenobacter sp. CA1UV-4]